MMKRDRGRVLSSRLEQVKYFSIFKMYQSIKANLLLASCLLVSVRIIAAGQEENLKLMEEASYPQLPVASNTNSSISKATDQQTDEPVPKKASWIARQMVNPSDGPTDMLSMIQRSLNEGKNSVEALVDEQFGVALPTRLIENDKDPNKSKIGNFDEGRKLSGSRRANKALQARVVGLLARLAAIKVVFEIIHHLVKLVLGGNAEGLNMILQSEGLGDLLESVKSLYRQVVDKE